MVVVVLLIAGIGFLLAGLLAIGFGIPVKEFSFGNTLILTGAVVACTGAMLLGLWVLVRELKSLALGSGVSLEPRLRNLLPSAGSSAPPLTIAALRQGNYATISNYLERELRYMDAGE